MENDNKTSFFNTETGSLKFGAGSLQIINGEECWEVPGLGIYDNAGKFIGETIDEAKQTLEKQGINNEKDEKT